MRTIDVVLFGNLIQAIDPTLATSRVSAEGAKDVVDARGASERELRKSRINLFCLQKIEFNLHNICEGKWLVT